MKITRRQLKRIIREEQQKLISEGTREKLNYDASGDSRNLDQEVYFGLEQGAKDLVAKFANNPRYSKYGVTSMDVLEELRNVVEELLSYR